LVDLILLGVPGVEVLAHHASHVHGLVRGAEVDAVRTQEVGEVLIRLVGARDPGRHQHHRQHRADGARRHRLDIALLHRSPCCSSFASMVPTSMVLQVDHF
jgi:hypothetical protein